MVFLLASPAAYSQFVHTQGTEIVDGSGKPLLIRGISIGNWFVLEGYFWRFGGLSQAQTEVELVFTESAGTNARAGVPLPLASELHVRGGCASHAAGRFQHHPNPFA